MIEVTRLDNSKILVNVEMIQSLQATPDTVITFTTNGKMIVKEPVDEVSKRILRYQRSMHTGVPYILREHNRAHSPYSTNTKQEDVKGIKVHNIKLTDK
ncbi:MAG: flagellar FlbD family protein [Deltaproteobacteria bacterium]|nr:flagellar FlbD family protein [Deltaproteobacteria bacterium]MBW1908120.1 flagellar FlbD family protein [Deltaproteobacteria bacterium]MBW2032199.1 flagellar FlbD family protein [Deltaproteobacteria bacterium]MBW2169707.1 flagellar FlbD family protein [Deltaproteobacteria bacterium]